MVTVSTCPGVAARSCHWGVVGAQRRLGTRSGERGSSRGRGLWRGRRWAGGSRPGSLARPSSWAPSVGSCGPSLSGSGRSWLSAQTAFSCSAFAEEQKLRKHEIVRRILKEEAEEGRRKQRPSPPRPAGRPILRARTWSYVAAFHAGKSTAGPPCCPPAQPAVAGRPQPPVHVFDVPRVSPPGLWRLARLETQPPTATCPLNRIVLGHLTCPQEGRSALPQASRLVKAVSSESVQADRGSLGRAEETLAQPEIPGLWKEDYKPYQVPKEDMDQKPVGGTKMDKDVLARTVQRLRSGVIHKQVASRREFRGCPFNSKPKLIHFKDFDIGKVYKKKITLINATYVINYCKLVGVEESLRDFIHIEY
ncbi:hypothetical protein J1605_000658 [Eschrichtius robustus]|uniref:Uncharacterized protein n=1 Tax=Eschrichtius robustus TaxID=9764 RepID=A0AB34GQ88_ESCRO|nr:hypothetical protein J1605_000658 [Eschrichtius robustus]